MSKSNGAKAAKPVVLRHRKVTKRDLVGTAEAAKILGVERPRIGRWKKSGIMPETVADLQAGPVWNKSDIERMVPYVVSIRRERGHAEPAKPAARKKASAKK